MFITIDKADFQQVVETWNQGFSDYLLPIHVDQKALDHRIQSLNLSKKLSAVFSVDGEFAGIILLGIETFQQTKVMWVGGMAVIPKYRRSKVASKLMDYAENVAKENHCDQLILEVIAANERARKLYEAKGFHTVNELAVGTIMLPTTSKAQRSIHFKLASVKELALLEKQWTPWQNRCIFSDKNYDIYQEETKIGAISFNLAEESGDKALILKQFHVPEQKNKNVITDILLTLKEQENVDSVKVANFDMEIPEYKELEKIGITLQLTQFQLAKKL
ncbi:GNAT family N-acetyltransferase [Enterococcus ureasiticus]|uniref:GNAT family N-acetyltransferase n=1 Tax=Enterococcus ureasiticus TaxID=903984 RepID=A0A1E5G9Y1_9ENTE|nr:GNAT family N-acetyltransferase [Enterococcus ureasiticus]OEG09467.1 GNAT family N-acetyltransferase [Enterococcus ureasiticus]